MPKTIQEQLQALVSEDKVSKESIEALLKQHSTPVAESAEAEEDEDDETDADESEDETDATDVAEADESEDEDGDDAAVEAEDAEPCACGAKGKVREAGMPTGVPKSGGTGKSTTRKGKEPARGRKFGEADVHRILADNERLRLQNGRLKEALTITQKRDRIAKLLKESKLPVQVRGPLSKRLMRLSSEAEVRDEIRFQQSLLESAVDTVAADLGDFDEIEGAGARFRESAGSGGNDELLQLVGQNLPLKATK